LKPHGLQDIRAVTRPLWGSAFGQPSPSSLATLSLTLGSLSELEGGVKLVNKTFGKGALDSRGLESPTLFFWDSKKVGRQDILWVTRFEGKYYRVSRTFRLPKGLGAGICVVGEKVAVRSGPRLLREWFSGALSGARFCLRVLACIFGK
jgi:hypothetical protein